MAGLDGYTAFSFGGWVRRNGAQPDGGFGILMAKLRATNVPWGLFIKDLGIRARMNTGADDASGNYWEFSADVTSGTWVHVFITWASGGKPVLYRNGIAQGYSFDGGTLTGTMTVETNTVIIGAANTTPSGLRFKGDAAELCLYSAALSSGEVAALASGWTPDKVRKLDMIAYWPMRGRIPWEKDEFSPIPYTTVAAPPFIEGPQVLSPKVIPPHSRALYLAAAGGTFMALVGDRFSLAGRRGLAA